jgi:hypothetical protein
MSWGDARSFCKDNQSTSDLVTITSPYENNYIKKIAKNQQTRLWIGLSDSLAEGSWQWVDDTNTNSWSNWAEGEPNGDRRENCGNISDTYYVLIHILWMKTLKFVFLYEYAMAIEKLLYL